MKAAIYKQYGPPDVLHLAEIETPSPKENEVLVKVFATTVTAGDCRMRAFDVPRGQWLFARLYLGVRGPKRPILGMELAGEVEAVGQQVTQFKPGDRVFGSTYGLDFGGYAEYKCFPEDAGLITMPTSLSFAEAAAVPVGGRTALHAIRTADIQPGQTVLIYGASGSVGTYAVQLAKYFGARITAVCSTANLELMHSIGADQTIDYTRQNLSNMGATYDFVFDAMGKMPSGLGKKLCKPGGTFINVNKNNGPHKPDGLIYLRQLIEADKIKPVIDRCYPLNDIVDAHRYVSLGHKKGNVVIIIRDEQD